MTHPNGFTWTPSNSHLLMVKTQLIQICIYKYITHILPVYYIYIHKPICIIMDIYIYIIMIIVIIIIIFIYIYNRHIVGNSTSPFLGPS